MEKNKIRLLYISDTLRQRSGITAVIRNYMTHFDWNKIQVDLLVNDTSETEVVDQMRKLGANVYFMPVLGMKNILFFFKFIKHFFAEHHYDIVHSHYYQLDTMVFPIAKRACGCKCISHSHSTKYSEYKLRSLRNWLLSRGIGKAADVWAACSNEAGEFLFGRMYRNSPKRLIVTNGIESREYIYSENTRKQKRKEFGISDDEIVIGHIGRMAPPKNPMFILDVFDELVKLGGEYRLMMVGNGPMEKEIIAKAAQLGLDDKIIFTGVRTDVPQLLNVFDIFLFPSLYEGLGLVAVEAQANGLNCIISDAVPAEVDLTGIIRLNLNENASTWAHAIEKMDTRRRVENMKKVIDAGYDIHLATLRLQDFYNQVIS